MSKYSKQQITEWFKPNSSIRINLEGGDAFVKENEKGEVALFRRDSYEVKEL